jgi:ubiquitin C-terminal hydrolase
MAEASNWKHSLDIKIEENMSRSSSYGISNPSVPNESDHSDKPLINDSFKDHMYLYKLNAVVLHYGSHDSGHFVTYRRFPRDQNTTKGKIPKAEKWYAISDDHVRRIWDVQGEVFGYAAQFVYLLFYERCRTSYDNS